MGIPKYILHPLLLLAGGALTLWLVWSRIPSTGEMRSQAGEKPSLPERSTLVAIATLDESGNFITEDGRAFAVDDSRLREPSAESLAKLRVFFIEKLFDPGRAAADGTLHLPIELYDPLCFKSGNVGPASCPVLLEK